MYPVIKIQDRMMKGNKVQRCQSSELGCPRVYLRRKLKFIFICLLLLVGEVFVFNMPYWQTRAAQSENVADYSLGNGVRRNGNTLSIKSNDDAYVEVKSDFPIKYLYLDSGAKTLDANISVQLSAQHQGNTGWYSGNAQKTINLLYDTSRYLHVGGNNDGVRIYFLHAAGMRIPIRQITINPRIPFNFSILRILLGLSIIVFCYFLFPGSRWYRIGFSTSGTTPRTKRIAILAAITIVQLFIVLGIWLFAGGDDAVHRWPQKIYGFTTDYDQYARLGDALLHGRTTLDLQVPDALAELDNPYDSDRRGWLVSQGNGPIYWDHAFYHGKYYSYFGVIPALVLFIPYQIITHSWLSASYAVLILGLLMAILITLLVIAIADKYFSRNVSIGVVVLAIMAVNVGVSMYYQIFTPNFYAIPGLASLACTFGGLTAWIQAKQPDGSVSKVLIALGSFCIAMNLGCRPQFILVAILALPLFWDELVRRRLFFARKGIGNTVAAFAPFIIVFIPLLAYNYIRFGSAFDFGANYNLTGFDMTIMETPLRDAPGLLFYYLFQPFQMTAVFPFFSKTSMTLPVWAPAEPSPGGLFWIFPFLALSIYVIVFLLKKTDFKNKWLLLSLLIFSFVVLLIDAYKCGFAWRYYIDFAWPLCLISVFVLFEISNLFSEKQVGDDVLGYRLSTSFVYLFALMVLIAYIVQFFMLFMLDRMTPMVDSNPAAYYWIDNWFLPFS